jgi:hypothetical protein
VATTEWLFTADVSRFLRRELSRDASAFFLVLSRKEIPLVVANSWQSLEGQ